MTLEPKFDRDVIALLPDEERKACLKELEHVLNQELQGIAPLSRYQEKLYELIEELEKGGFELGRWEYDCEIEYWGGKRYMNPELEDELILKSEYPHGVRLCWGEFTFE